MEKFCSACAVLLIKAYSSRVEGLSNVLADEHVERVLATSQNYEALKSALAAALDDFSGGHGVLLSRHGLYTWGETVAEARRHLRRWRFCLR